MDGLISQMDGHLGDAVRSYHFIADLTTVLFLGTSKKFPCFKVWHLQYHYQALCHKSQVWGRFHLISCTFSRFLNSVCMYVHLYISGVFSALHSGTFI